MKKHGVCVGIGDGLVSCSELLSGFQDMSQDNGLGKGQGCSQVQEDQPNHLLLRLAPGVYCVQWERLFIKPPAVY